MSSKNIFIFRTLCKITPFMCLTRLVKQTKLADPFIGEPFWYLKMNRWKLKLMVLTARQRPARRITSVSICDDVIEPSVTANNIEITFDLILSMESPVNVTCKSAFHYLRNLRRIEKYILVQSASVTSAVDFIFATRISTAYQIRSNKNFRAPKMLQPDW